MRGLGFLFDLDGTLIDSLPVVELAWGNWALRHGVPEAEVLDFIHGKQAITSLRHFMPGQSEETIQHEYRLLERFEAETIDGVSALPGARKLLNDLNRLQLPWAIVTSGSLPVASARVNAGRLPTPPVLITAEQLPRGKPQPDPYLLGAKTLGLLLAAVVLFITGKVRMDVVALLVIVAFVLSGTLTLAEATAGFSDPNVLLIAELFVIGDGLVRTGIALSVGDWLVRMAGNSELRMLLLSMVTVSALGAFMSSIGLVAIFIPVVLSVAQRMKSPPGRLMMPLSFAGLISGMMTLVATPPNMVVNSELLRNDLPAVNLPAEVDQVAPAASQAPHALLALVLMVGMMITDHIPNPIAALIACLLMGKFRCIDMNSAYKAIHWPSLILIVGMMPFALALEKTGGVDVLVRLLMRL